MDDARRTLAAVRMILYWVRLQIWHQMQCEWLECLALDSDPSEPCPELEGLPRPWYAAMEEAWRSHLESPWEKEKDRQRRDRLERARAALLAVRTREQYKIERGCDISIQDQG